MATSNFGPRHTVTAFDQAVTDAKRAAEHLQAVEALTSLARGDTAVRQILEGVYPSRLAAASPLDEGRVVALSHRLDAAGLEKALARARQEAERAEAVREIELRRQDVDYSPGRTLRCSCGHDAGVTFAVALHSGSEHRLCLTEDNRLPCTVASCDCADLYLY
ncbi:hypothetical protein ACWGAN_07435 [Streptomyces sp. NPDC054945]